MKDSFENCESSKDGDELDEVVFEVCFYVDCFETNSICVHVNKNQF